MPIILATQEAEIRRIKVRSQPGQTVCRTLLKNNSSQKEADGVAQMVECLPSNCEAPECKTQKKKKNQKNPSSL
jgi:hypothetical protein